MALTHVMTPIKISQLEIKNRIVRPAHATNLGQGTMNDDLIAYHEACAKGGVGLSFLEILSVHDSSPGYLHAWAPGLEAGYRKLIDRVRPTGMRLFQQLWHGGHGAIPVDRSAPWSASQVMSPGVSIVPRAMTKAMIDEIVEAFATSARRVEEWGIEGAEIHAGHGYLVNQFLSFNHNRRTDEYGGTFENRARFLFEILAAVRSATTARFVLGVRIGADETKGGISPSELAKLRRMLEARRLIDFVNVSLGGKTTNWRMVSGMYEPAGYMMPTSLPVTRGATVPSIVVGRFRTLEEADALIRAGEADMVAINRALIADPDLVLKTVSGHAEQVRPCIACNQGCLAGASGMSLWDPRVRIGCAVNPGAGRELTVGDHLLAPAISPKHVLVVGGGPAGMEAARVARLRGHEVTLLEAQPRLGGAINIAAAAPKRQALRDITVWLESEVYRLGVEVVLNTHFDASDVSQWNPDEIVIATGSSPGMDGMQASNPGDKIEGFDQPHVVSSNDVLTTSGKGWGKSAVVIDDLGHYEALAAAEHLAEQGLAVTFVTRFPMVSPLMQWTFTTEPTLERLDRLDSKFLTHSRAIAIGKDSVVVGKTFPSNKSETVSADTVVFVSGNRPNVDGLEHLPAGLPAHFVGDANGPRFLQAAIAEAHKIAAAIN